MTQKIGVLVDAEDNLLIVIALRLLAEFGDKYEITDEPQIHQHSKSGIEKYVLKLNRAGPLCDVHLVLMDMDSLAFPQNKRKCPDSEIRRLLRNESQSPNLLFRIAVFESESWLLADWGRLKKFLKMESANLAGMVDEIENPKKHLRSILRQNAPEKYKRINKHLMDFARDQWRPRTAAKNSKSLQRTLRRLEEYHPEMSE